MKIVSLIILLLCLLQPMACFAYPCDSCPGNPDIEDVPAKSGSHSHSQDVDSCDSTVCCEEIISSNTGNTVIYAPLISVITMPERNQKLLKLVIPIFVPPQNLS